MPEMRNGIERAWWTDLAPDEGVLGKGARRTVPCPARREDPAFPQRSARPRPHPRARRPDARRWAGPVTWSVRSHDAGSSLQSLSSQRCFHAPTRTADECAAGPSAEGALGPAHLPALPSTGGWKRTPKTADRGDFDHDGCGRHLSWRRTRFTRSRVEITRPSVGLIVGTVSGRGRLRGCRVTGAEANASCSHVLDSSLNNVSPSQIIRAQSHLF